MAHSGTSIAEHMVEHPYTIGKDQTLERAIGVMREHRIRHLPVLDAGGLVGIVTERDVALVSAMKGVDPHALPVAEAMTPEPFAVPPSAPLGEVVHEMARRKLGAAVVMNGGSVVGIFTAVDGLRVLADLLGAESDGSARGR